MITSSALFAADVLDAAAPVSSAPAAPQTLTGDWFGYGPAMRGEGIDLRIEWSQFYQGMLKGDRGDASRSAYGGKLDAQVRFDLSKWGLWEGLSVTVQGVQNYGRSVNGAGGSLIPVNAALYFPGIEGADASDIMALYVQQNFGSVASLLVGKFNLTEFARGTPLRAAAASTPSGTPTWPLRSPAFRRRRSPARS